MRTTAFATFVVLAVAVLAVRPAATQAQDDTAEEQALQSMQHMLRRAELVRMLSAVHLNYINSQDDKSDVRLMDDASQVMAYHLVCDDPSFEARTLNKIAAETTLKIALKVEGSPVEKAMTEALGNLSPEDRLTLVADVSSTVLMFKIGRRRGLFDALLTDFGTNRFCKGMGGTIRDLYYGLSSFLNEPAEQ